MSRKGKRRRNKRNVKQYNNFNRVNTNPNKRVVLILSQGLEYVLKKILKNGHNKIADRLLKDNGQTIYAGISWLNITQSNEYISYSTPGKVKEESDAWVKKNRHPAQIKKLIRKLYRNTFTNSDIKTFSAKFRTVYSQLQKIKKEIDKNKKQPVFTNNKVKISSKEHILNGVYELTEMDYIKWVIKSDESYYINYYSEYDITDNKKLLFTFYDLERTRNVGSGSPDFLSVYFYEKDIDKKTYLSNIDNDEDGLFLLKKEIERNVRL